MQHPSNMYLAWEGVYRLAEEIIQQNTSNTRYQEYERPNFKKSRTTHKLWAPAHRLLARPSASYSQGPCPNCRSYFFGI